MTSAHIEILNQINELYDVPVEQLDISTARTVFESFLAMVEKGEVRAAWPKDPLDGGLSWQVEPAVKKGILLGFRIGKLSEMSSGNALQFSDKDTYPVQRLPVMERNIRIVPGGNSVRRGSYIGHNVTMMPPAFVNVGAYVGDGSMIDSHALVGSCAQVGKNVHISAGAQIGGVLEPIGQTPVIIEDGVLLGGNTGIYEGVHIQRDAVIGSGCVITASTPIYDLVREDVYRATADKPLTIPTGAVVIPGSRPAKGDFAKTYGLQMAALLIVKYRDDKTAGRTELEDSLR